MIKSKMNGQKMKMKKDAEGDGSVKERRTVTDGGTGVRKGR